MTLRVDLFGGVRVSLDGAPFDVGGRRPRALLASLALANGNVVGGDRLIDLIWGDDPPRTARRTLQSYVSGLRKLLGGDDGPLAASGAGYVLAIDRRHIDLFVFADAVVRARNEMSDDPPAAVAAQLRAALESWAEPLEGLRPSPRLQAILVPYEELRLQALETLNDVELNHGEVSRAVARLETLVREDPIRERFWTQLAEGLATLGRRDQALQACQRAREALREQLGVTPAPLLHRLERELLDGWPQRPSESPARSSAETVPPGNLVRPPTEFIGRKAELHHAQAELTNCRLITFTGPGGVGKTRLAIELGLARRECFPGGVWLVELAPVADPRAVPTALASTLSVPPQGDMTVVESVVDWLRGRHVLLIIDNCEHVLPTVAELVATVVTGCPTVTVLATSREPLGLSAERVHLVIPLDPTSEGTELFVERALAADTSFRPSADDRVAITDICTRLEGIPLAIELAASLIRSLAPVDLLTRLDERFRLLHGPVRNGGHRHRTMRATVDWSYQLLEPREQLLFDRLSVFVGGFELAAAEAACADDGVLEYEKIARVVASLVDKSMIVADRGLHGVRYRQLEPMRQYGNDRLHVRGEYTVMQERHLEYYLDASRRANALWCSRRQIDADHIFEREWDNLRAAHAWAISTANLPAAECLIATTAVHAWCRLKLEHGEWATRTLTLESIDNDPNASTYGWAAYWAYFRDEHVRAVFLPARASTPHRDPTIPTPAGAGVCSHSTTSPSVGESRHDKTPRTPGSQRRTIRTCSSNGGSSSPSSKSHSTTTSTPYPTS